MVRTKNPATHRRRLREPLDPRREIWDRISTARRLTQWDGRLGEWTLKPGQLPSAGELLRITGEMGIDPRWLATGRLSPAGLADVDAMGLFGRRGFGAQRDAAYALLADGVPLPFGVLATKLGVERERLREILNHRWFVRLPSELWDTQPGAAKAGTRRTLARGQDEEAA